MQPVPLEMIRLARELADRHGALLVIDEIQTGLSRTGPLFAYEDVGVVPDVMMLAKSLGGGVPIGAVVARPEFDAVLQPGDHGSTFAASPLACAAALASCAVLDDPGLQEGVRRKGARLLAGLEGLVADGLASEARGRGLMCAIDLPRPRAAELVHGLLEAGTLRTTPQPARCASCRRSWSTRRTSTAWWPPCGRCCPSINPRPGGGWSSVPGVRPRRKAGDRVSSDTSPPEAAARAVDAVKIYGKGDTAVRALDGVNVEFAAGDFSAIMGPSGSGKSTLMHCLAGLDSVTSGEIWLGDINLAPLDEKEKTKVRRDNVGFIFQAFNLIPTLTAAENITLPLDIAGRKVDREWMDTIVSTVGIGDRLTHKPSELSGGQQQRVAAARAFVARPKVVFADEPTGALDSTSGAELLGFMRRAVDEFGQTLVMVTHDPIAASYASRVVFLSDGRVVDELHAPTSEEVLDHVKALAAV